MAFRWRTCPNCGFEIRLVRYHFLESLVYPVMVIFTVVGFFIWAKLPDWVPIISILLPHVILAPSTHLLWVKYAKIQEIHEKK